MTAADGTKIAEDLQHSMNCSAWKDMHGHDINGEDCTCGLRFRIEISTLRTLKAAWEKRAYEAEERERLLREALGIMYDKWENGTPCLEVGEDGQCIDGTSMGNAFKLSFAEEQTVLNLIVEKAEEFEEACANCSKPYRAHLLHDKNRCRPNADATWFPGSIAAALATPAQPQTGGNHEQG